MTELIKDLNRLERLHYLMQKIPMQPRSVRIRDLLIGYEKAFEAQKRTLERDIEALEYADAIKSHLIGRTKHVSKTISQLEEFVDLSLNVPSAMAFVMLKELSGDILPPVIGQELELYIKKSEKLLQSSKSAEKYKRFIEEKVGHVPNRFELQPPKYLMEGGLQSIMEPIGSALLDDYKIECKYRPVNSKATKQYTLFPLAIISRGTAFYLIAKDERASKIKQFAIHRFSSITRLDTRGHIPLGFTLASYIEEGNLSWRSEGSNGMIKVRLKCKNSMENLLRQQPIAKTVKFQKCDDDDHFIVEAKVADTSEFRWWILSFEEGIEVLEPESLRNTIKSKLQLMLENYSS